MSFVINATFGALLLGVYCAAVLSGVFVVQTFLYIKLFPQDSLWIKVIVGLVWTLDTTHSILVYVTTWNYLITDYGNEAAIDTISIPLALTVITTAVLTFIVHCFFAHRIHKLSRHRWQFTVLIFLLALFRLCCASVTTAEMIVSKTLQAFFRIKFRTVFTLGLATSCVVDILITGFLTYTLNALQKEQKESTSLDRIIRAVVMYTFETNMLTSAATILAMIFWVTMSDTLIFMGIHFSISKLYANSLLATLNTRKQLQDQRQRDTSGDLPSGFPIQLSNFKRKSSGNITTSCSEPLATKLKINVEKTIEFDGDECSPPQSFNRVSTFEPQTK